jgi:hypothetical protein
MGSERGQKDPGSTANRIARRRVQQTSDDLRAVLATLAGRRYLFRLVERCGVFSPVFNPNGSTMTHAEGRRSVGIDLMHDFQRADPGAWVGAYQDELALCESERAEQDKNTPKEKETNE